MGRAWKAPSTRYSGARKGLTEVGGRSSSGACGGASYRRKSSVSGRTVYALSSAVVSNDALVRGGQNASANAAAATAIVTAPLTRAEQALVRQWNPTPPRKVATSVMPKWIEERARPALRTGTARTSSVPGEGISVPPGRAIAPTAHHA